MFSNINYIYCNLFDKSLYNSSNISISSYVITVIIPISKGG